MSGYTFGTSYRQKTHLYLNEFSSLKSRRPQWSYDICKAINFFPNVSFSRSIYVDKKRRPVHQRLYGKQRIPLRCRGLERRLVNDNRYQ